ncbi:hypothetical protein IAR50_003113 [Cryptococcus sp. DSM 104548]
MSRNVINPPAYPAQVRSRGSSPATPTRDVTLIERMSGNNSRHTSTKSPNDIPFPAASPLTNPWRKLKPDEEFTRQAAWRSFLNIYDNAPPTPAPANSPVLMPTTKETRGFSPLLAARVPVPETPKESWAEKRDWKTSALRELREKEKEREREKVDEDWDVDDSPLVEKDDPFSSVPLEHGALGSLRVSGEGYESGSEDGNDEEDGSASDRDDGKDDKKEVEESEEDYGSDELDEVHNYAPRRPPLTPKVSSFAHTNRYRHFGHINCPAFHPLSQGFTCLWPEPSTKAGGRYFPQRVHSLPIVPGLKLPPFRPSKVSSSVVVQDGEPTPCPTPPPQHWPQPRPHPPTHLRTNHFSIAPCFNGLQQGEGPTRIIMSKAKDETGVGFGMLKRLPQRTEGWEPVEMPRKWVLMGHVPTEKRVMTLGSMQEGLEVDE